MSTYYIHKNSYFTAYLKKKLEQDIILFGSDGISYFGRLKQIIKDSITVLEPASISSTALVEILNASTVTIVENTTSINICNIDGFGSDFSGDPFVIPADNAESFTIEAIPSAIPSAPELASRVSACVQENLDHDYKNDDISLTDIIALQKGNLITLSTLGGFLFAGELLYTRGSVAFLQVTYIFAPGGDGTTLSSIGKVTIDLETVTSFSK